MSDDEDDIWGYKSIRKCKASGRHTEEVGVPQRGRGSGAPERGRGSGAPPKRGGNRKRNAPKKTTVPPRLASPRPEQSIGGARCQEAVPSTPERADAVRSPVTPRRKHSGHCPSCQMPFSILLVQTPRWHTSECLDAPPTAQTECPDGVRCASTLPSHYKRHSHFLLAQSRAMDCTPFSPPCTPFPPPRTPEVTSPKAAVPNGFSPVSPNKRSPKLKPPKSRSPSSSSQESVPRTPLDVWLSSPSKASQNSVSSSQESSGDVPAVTDHPPPLQHPDPCDTNISYSPLVSDQELFSDDEGDLGRSSPDCAKVIGTQTACSNNQMLGGRHDNGYGTRTRPDRAEVMGPDYSSRTLVSGISERSLGRLQAAADCTPSSQRRVLPITSQACLLTPQRPVMPASQRSPTLPAVPASQRSPTLPAVPASQRSPTLPAVPASQRSPTLPAVPASQRSPTLPAVPASQRSPTLPAVPTSQRSPTLPAVPASQRSPTLPAVPASQRSPTLPAVPASQRSPTLPAVPASQRSLSMPAVPASQRSLSMPAVPAAKAMKQMDIGVFFGLKPKVAPAAAKVPAKTPSPETVPSQRERPPRKRKAMGSSGDAGGAEENMNGIPATAGMGTQQRGGKKFRQNSNAGEWGRGRKQCPFYKKIPGTGFSVDAFQYGEIEGCSAYFLTHFHSDHYGGLTKKFRFPIYCSKITGNLVQSKLRVEKEFIHCLPMDTECSVNGVRVVLLEANHCPGAVLLLFILPNGSAVLHTGDFRADTSMERYPALQSRKIHTVYLDTTYCSPEYTFPPQAEAVQFAVNAAFEMVTLHPRTLVVCGTYSVGKEKVFLGIADVLGCKVCMSQDKYKTMQCLESDEIRVRVTTDWHSTALHVLPMMQVNFKGLYAHFNKFPGKYDRVLAFKPTGWTYSEGCRSVAEIRPEVRGKVTLYGIPYSEHSSYSEMKRFVQFLKPQKIIPTVNVGSGASRAAMEKHFTQWLSEARR